MLENWLWNSWDYILTRKRLTLRILIVLFILIFLSYKNLTSNEKKYTKVCFTKCFPCCRRNSTKYRNNMEDSSSLYRVVKKSKLRFRLSVVIRLVQFSFNWQWLIFVIIHGIVCNFRVKCSKVECKIRVVDWHWVTGRGFRFTKLSVFENGVCRDCELAVNNFLSELCIMNSNWMSNDMIFTLWSILTKNAAETLLFQAIFLNVSVNSSWISVNSATIWTLRTVVGDTEFGCWMIVVLIFVLLIVRLCRDYFSVDSDAFWVKDLSQDLECCTFTCE